MHRSNGHACFAVKDEDGHAGWRSVGEEALARLPLDDACEFFVRSHGQMLFRSPLNSPLDENGYRMQEAEIVESRDYRIAIFCRKLGCKVPPEVECRLGDR